MRARLLYGSFLPAILFPIAVAAQSSPSIPEVVRNASRAVVSLHTFDSAGQRSGMGSGFIVQGGRIVTNSHVVEGASRVEVFDSDGQLLGTTQHAEALSGTVDIAVLPRMSRVPATLALSAATPAVGEQILAIGAPEGLTNTVSDGLVSAFRSWEGRRWIQISAPISQGSSGGPILNRHGQVVGVSVAVLREGQNLNFAVPASDVHAMLGSPPGHVAFGAAAVGTRTTEVAATGSPTTPMPVRIGVGQTVSGSLKAHEWRTTDGRHGGLYTFSGRRGQTVTISARSPDFDTYIYVARKTKDGVEDVAEDDDSGNGTNSQITATLSSDGEYMVFVTSVGAGATGRYNLSLALSAGTASSGSAAVPSDRWLEAGGSSNFVNELDRTRIAAVGNGVYRVWARTTYAEPETVEGISFDLSMTQQDVDCRGMRTRIVSLTQYHKGHVVYSSPSGMPPLGWNSWVPDSVGEKEGQVLCAYVRQQGL